MALKTADFIKEIKAMKVQDLNELVKAIEEEFGVTAAAPMAGGAAVADDGPTTKTLVLTAAGGSKIAVIKLIREILGLGLMEAKTFVDAPGGTIKENVSEEEAEELIAKFTGVGATVEAK